MTGNVQVETPNAGFTSERGLIVRRYEAGDAAIWDAFVRSGKNASFLFQRGYMDYHSDRFVDHSLMVFDGQRLVAVLPANLTNGTQLLSHGGLTYGGFVFGGDARLSGVLEVFRAALEYMAVTRLEQLHYRRIPRFYSVLPDDEVDYALFLLKAALVRRDIALVVPLRHRLTYSKRRQRDIKRARTAGVQIIENLDFENFWTQILSPRLQRRYGVSPVHSIEEIGLLASRFPENIKQFSAFLGGEILAGTTIYETPTVAHVQYSAMSEIGQQYGALDAIVDFLINERYAEKCYFDFGISNEKGGLALNHGLLDWKEGFGARSVAHDFYVIDPNEYMLLDSAIGPR